METKRNKRFTKLTLTDLDRYDKSVDSIQLQSDNKIAIRYQDPVSLFRYLLFCFVLANDHAGLKNHLVDVRKLKYEWIWISKKEIAFHENKLLDGILENSFYRQLWHDVDQKRNKSNEYIHIIELACVLKPTYVSTSVIEIILQYIMTICESVLHDIICNRNIDAITVKQLVHHALEREKRFDNYHAFGRMVSHLFDQYVKETYARQRMILSKLCLLFDHGHAIRFTPWQIKGFMLKAMNSDSILLLCCLNYLLTQIGNIPQFDIIDSLKDILIQACTRRMYYMVHLIVKLFKHQVKNSINFIKNYIFEIPLLSFDLYLFNYLLRHELINFTTVIHSQNDLKQQFLKYWLLCCCDPDKSRYITQWNIFKSEYSISELSLRIGILCELGANIEQENNTHKTQLQRCASTLNINLLRALIINNCNLDKNTMKAVCWDIFAPLRYAELSEIIKTQRTICRVFRILIESGADFHSNTVRYIQGIIKCDYKGHDFEDVNWIQTWFREPPSLRFFCRKAIRKRFGKQLTRCLCDLEYPKALKDYIRTIIL